MTRDHPAPLRPARARRNAEWVVAAAGARVSHGGARRQGLACEPVEPVDGPAASLLLRVSGAERGSVRARPVRHDPLDRHQPFPPDCTSARTGSSAVDAWRRRPKTVADLREEDIDYQTLRASGPGGQHVNKTDSAVRATHRPDRPDRPSQDQRSQFANRKIARLKLAMLIEEQRGRSEDQARRSEWELHQQLERGNPVRTYAGPQFRLKTG